VDTQTGVRRTGFERSEVRMKTLSDAEIERYVATCEPMDKAGSYGIQGFGAVFIQYIRGCYFNVMGLPLARLYLMVDEISKEVGPNRPPDTGGPIP
jgi:septum formation protein